MAARVTYQAIRPTGPIARWRRSVRTVLALVGVSVFGLAACAIDRESAVRAQLGSWVVLGETVYFKSSLSCTAGVFETGASSVMSGAKKVQSTDRALSLIQQGKAVAFTGNGVSPAQAQTQIDEIDRPVSLAILTSALAARDCFPEGIQAQFTQALNAGDVVLIFDPTNSAVALFDRAQDQVFYTRAKR